MDISRRGFMAGVLGLPLGTAKPDPKVFTDIPNVEGWYWFQGYVCCAACPTDHQEYYTSELVYVCPPKMLPQEAETFYVYWCQPSSHSRPIYPARSRLRGTFTQVDKPLSRLGPGY